MTGDAPSMGFALEAAPEQQRQRCVLLTGATGFLGAQIARRLVHVPGLTLIALVRAEDQAAAARRLARAWWDWPDRVAARVEVLAGDVSQPRLGLDGATYARLAGCITHIIHAAADLRLDAPLDELRKTNVEGTVNMLALARHVQREHGLERFAHISTAYVAGGRSGAISEADLTGEHGFSNAYEYSKYEAERLVQTAKSALPISVFRPGMVVGATDTGQIRVFNTVYFPLRLYLTGKLPIIPAERSMPVNMIPVDYVAQAIARLTFLPEAEGLNFHLTAPPGALPRVGELLDAVRAWAREYLDLRLPRPPLIRLPLRQKPFRPDQKPAAASRFRAGRVSRGLSELGSLLTLLPYFNERKQFRRDNVDRLFGPYTLDWRESLPHMLAFAVDNNFLHRTERTVHEQVLARLASRTRPVNYIDIVQGQMIRRSAGEVRREILASTAALTALGIQPGDRVAIVGLNNSRYLALDVAIGLVGAVSVPLYYTSPPVEVDHILAASGARLLLVGAPKILERLGEIQTDLPVVSFCRGALPSAGLGREVILWEAFLALGVGRQVQFQAPVGFGDLATLRYTSGTTGQPKGVSFQHQHLRWMGQAMASLMPWKDRNRPANYLSFLPMNHVVEGILANYCPYYVPTAVNIYFLEDLRDLQQTLPRVRPKVFFSVPRIFEKIWKVLEENPVGQRYLSLPGGPVKRALGALLCRRTLQKIGLDRCALMIAGAAPCGKGLLQHFRELGIEIYNAYGLTEAPLVTLNRLGANRLGTVGRPAPQTEVRLAEDGEVLVRGPQVMAGYYDAQPVGKMAQPFRDGWLLTGDLGELLPDGSLVLKGRKNERFKTSYGYYVHPEKVETLLRQIPGVVEALLVGKERPYCVALLWVEAQALDARARQCIDQTVGQINRGLSHPEQVKRWAVLSNDLSIEAGDLTASLKLKRQAVARRLEDVLDGLYDGSGPSPAALHMGEAGKD